MSTVHDTNYESEHGAELSRQFNYLSYCDCSLKLHRRCPGSLLFYWQRRAGATPQMAISLWAPRHP
jgi:hypothetical protein